MSSSSLLGLFLSILLSTLGGFSLAGIVIGLQADIGGLIRYGFLVIFSLGISLTFLCLAVLVAIASKRKVKSFGVSLFLWFFFVLFYDLVIIGGIQLVEGAAANTLLFLSLLGNPVGMVRVATLIVLDNVTIFGAPGAALLRFFGGSVTSVLVLMASLALWIIVPIAVSHRLLRRQDI
jgi:Cu-processing system permease protein